MTRTLAVIPARLASSRFPNKPLKMILGIPMIAHCYYRALLCKNVDKLILATPDKEIIELSDQLGFQAIMTSDKHERATERACEVLDILKSDGELYDNVLLLQGDEPQINPETIDQLIKEITESNNDVINLIHPIENIDEIFDSDISGYFLGPYDLSASIGSPGKFETIEFIDMEKKILKAAEKHNVSKGIHVVEPNIESFNQKVSDGYELIAFSVDFRMLETTARKPFKDD